jgi:hypothetical protein
MGSDIGLEHRMRILWVNFAFVREVNIAALAGVRFKIFTLESGACISS